jgi:hypothetical protein
LGEKLQSQGGKGAKPRREGSRPWIVTEFVADLIFAPLVRGVLWLFLHLALAIKIAFIKVFLS